MAGLISVLLTTTRPTRSNTFVAHWRNWVPRWELVRCWFLIILPLSCKAGPKAGCCYIRRGGSECAVEDILQGNFQVVEQAAFERCDQRCPSFFGHFSKLPIRANSEKVMEGKRGVFERVDIHRFICRVHDTAFFRCFGTARSVPFQCCFHSLSVTRI